MKLWDKGQKVNTLIEDFTVGKDYLLDMHLIEYDLLASKAHALVIADAGLLTQNELDSLLITLDEIITLVKKGEFVIQKSDEDCHTAIENYLTLKLGDVGKKIHIARSRNDQVLTALRLFEKHELNEISALVKEYIKALENLAEKNKSIPLPGYTHTQKAMPTTISTWLGSFVDSGKDSVKLLTFTQELINQSPLGSAAGFGVPVFNINNKKSATEMGFSKSIENPIYAQLTRAKFDGLILSTLTHLMFDLNKLSSDLILFSTPEFGYLKLPESICTGSSIMPQKKNPDTLELVRANYHIVLGEEFKQKSLTSNLISGYHRDIQLTKESMINSLTITKKCYQVMIHTINGITINSKNCEKAMTIDLYATEKAYKLVKEGMPFREAYKKVAETFK